MGTEKREEADEEALADMTKAAFVVARDAAKAKAAWVAARDARAAWVAAAEAERDAWAVAVAAWIATATAGL